MFAKILLCGALLVAALPSAAIDLGADGLHKPDWLRQSSGDLRQDLRRAEAEGRRVMLLVEQKGCPYCARLHEETLTDARVLALLREAYFPIQLDLHGTRMFVDTDGERLPERDLMRKWRVFFTPTMVFLPVSTSGRGSASDEAVIVMIGAIRADMARDVLTWVLEERYADPEDAGFAFYHDEMTLERKERLAPGAP